MAETALLIIAVILMLAAVIASIIPFVPGPALVWVIGVFFAIITDFNSVSVFSLVIMTILMILGSTTNIWMQALGMQVQGASCLSMIGSMIGGLIGTFVISIPLLGTLIGVVLGALVFELARLGDFRRAAQTGSAAASGYLLGILVEGAIGLAIIALFVFSATAPVL